MAPTLLGRLSFANCFAEIKIVVAKRCTSMGSFMGSYWQGVGTHEIRRTGYKKAAEPISTRARPHFLIDLLAELVTC
jgi:hypothetical protein